MMSTSSTTTTTTTTTSAATKSSSSSNKSKRPLFLPNSQAASKKRRTVVHRTHSPPKPRPSCSSTATPTPTTAAATNRTGHDHVKCIQPNVQGVEEGARIMRQGQVLAIPTETVYALCTCIDATATTATATTTTTATTTGGRQDQQEGVQQLQSLSIDPTPQATILLHSLHNLDSMLALAPKSFAIAPHKPVAFHEGYQVLLRLAAKLWPGPICMYISAASPMPALPSCVLRALDSATFVGLQYPSHPLMSRMLQQVHKKAGANDKDLHPTNHSSHNNGNDDNHQQPNNNTHSHKKHNRKTVLVISTPALNTQRHYLTTAQAVVDHYDQRSGTTTNNNKAHPGGATTSDAAKRAAIHVLRGEDRKEWLAVPTCTYGKPSGTSLWIHTNTRTVYMVGDVSQDAPAAVVTSKQLLHAMNRATIPPAPTNPATLLTAAAAGTTATTAVEDKASVAEHAKYRWRVMAAVLRKWRVVDQRTNHRVQEQEGEDSGCCAGGTTTTQRSTTHARPG